MNYRPLITLAMAVSLSGPFARGQTPPVETVTLSPFEVTSERGTGYRATNSISATRLDTPLQDVPVNIQVVTRDFLQDTLSFRIEDALQYQAGVSLSQQDREQGIFNVRGFTNNRVKRNGFTTYYVHDLGNTERVEVVKGPSSLLYGEMDPGGVINYITRRPGPVARHSLNLTVGSYDHYRATLESSGPVGERVRYGLTASLLDDERWTDDWGVKQHSLNGTIQWSPWRGANLTVEGTTLRRREDLRSQVFIYNKANYEAWLQLPEAQRIAIAMVPGTDQPSEFVQVNAAGTGLIHSGRRPFWTDVADFLPRQWNTAQGDLDSDMDELAVSFETPLGDRHNLRSILRYTETSLLWSSPAGGNSRLGVSRDGLRGGANSSRLQQNEDLFAQIDLTGNYRLTFGTLRWVAGWERMDAEFRGTTWQRQLGATGVPWIYFDPVLARPLTVNEIGGPGGTSPLFPARPLGDAFGRIQSDDGQQNDVSSFYGIVQASLLRERLFLMGGLRREQSQTEDSIWVGNFVAQNPVLVIDNPEDTATVPQAGASVKVFPGVNVFASYSESFRPQRGVGRDINGNNFKKPPQRGEGLDVGIKVGTEDGRFSGTISYFDITVTDIMGRATPPGGGTQYDIVIDGRQVDGWEFDGVWQEGGNQLILSYAKLSGEGLGSGAGQPIANMPEERFAVWNKYEFTQGRLRGAFIAGGYNYTSARSISSGLGPADIRDGSYGLWDAALGYTTKLGGREVEFRLNVKNIFDEEYIMGGALSGYWGDPRLVFFSSRINF